MTERTRSRMRSAAARTVGLAGRDRTTAVLVTVAVLAAACCAGFGVRWWAAAASADARGADARETALRDGSRALEILHTIDHRTAESDVDRWLTVTGGTLHRNLAGDLDEHVGRAERGRTDASASTVRAALSELDATKGTARLLTVLRIDLSGAGEADPRTRRSGLLATLARDGDVWKVTGVQEVGS
ncbi:hypothetical protein HQ32_02114 [Prauserella sp. Am3]|nr:hypothetical protein HQ32_02114 [Prauserella sp. Am3]